MRSLPIGSHKRITIQTTGLYVVFAYATLAIIAIATHAIFMNAPAFRTWEIAEDVFLFGITALLLRTVMKGASISLRRYSLLAEHTGEIALFVGPDKRIIDVNEAATLAYGYTRAELIGLPLEAHVYMKRLNAGIWADEGEALGNELREYEAAGCERDLLRNEISDYHLRYKPHEVADLVVEVTH